MVYFCPIHTKWFEYSEEDSINNFRLALHINQRVESSEKSIIDLWNKVPVPAVPEIKRITVNPGSTALLILDMENSICQSQRCKASINSISKFLMKARKYGLLVIYSLIPDGTPQDIFKEIAPLQEDPIVKSNVDKFYKTNLLEILEARNINTLIVTGYASNGAVLHTATSAAFRGYNVIVPVECMSANTLYAEQYTAWHMLNSPGTRNHAFLTKADLIRFSN